MRSKNNALDYGASHKGREILFKLALDKWGLYTQLSVAKEEAAELITAISHWERKRDGAVEELIDEIADVQIVLHQLVQFVGIEGEEVERRIEEKLLRLASRLSL